MLSLFIDSVGVFKKNGFFVVFKIKRDSTRKLNDYKTNRRERAYPQP